MKLSSAQRTITHLGILPPHPQIQLYAHDVLARNLLPQPNPEVLTGATPLLACPFDSMVSRSTSNLPTPHWRRSISGFTHGTRCHRPRCLNTLSQSRFATFISSRHSHHHTLVLPLVIS